jgi:ribonuclease T2
MKTKAAPSLLILLLLTACSPPPRPTPEPAPRPTAAAAQTIEPASTTQSFDYYLLNLSWSPEFCHSHPNATECVQHPAFVLHGLWPQNTNGGYPQNCSTDPGPRDPSTYTDIYPDPGLLRHEWRTHGTCSGLSPDAFFTLARNAYKAVAIPPTLAQLDHQISLTPSEPIHPRGKPRHQLRQQLPHRRRGLPRQTRSTHLLRPHPLVPRQLRPHHPALTRKSLPEVVILPWPKEKDP